MLLAIKRVKIHIKRSKAAIERVAFRALSLIAVLRAAPTENSELWQRMHGRVQGHTLG